MRMRVGGLDATVGRPARVTDALGRARIGADTAVDATDIFVDEEVIRGGEGQPPRVVASILERFQRGEDRVTEIGLLADVAEYAAHAFPSLAGTPAQRITNRRPSRLGCANFAAKKRGNVGTGIRPHTARVLSADHSAGLVRT